MADETFVLIMLVVVMLVGSYIAGFIPLVIKLSEEKLKCITVLGAGLLVGCALGIIIPEGVRSLYLKRLQFIEANYQHQTQLKDNDGAVAEFKIMLSDKFENHIIDYSLTIGLSLVIGFVFMMLIDQISQQSNASNHKNHTATIGLVVHAAADGIALGAAATTSQPDVEIIVFLAIMLHKAPAAFGLVTFLLHEKIDRKLIRKHLMIFSMSAPLLTLLTYFGIGQEQKDTLNSVNATGIALLFSAGTFLYVATVHVLPELTQEVNDCICGHKNHTQIGFAPQFQYCLLEDGKLSEVNKQDINKKSPIPINILKLKYIELFLLICGSFLPILFTYSHYHS